MDLLFPLLIVFMIGMIFFSNRQRKKQAAKQESLQNAISVGDVVVMTSGISGTVVDTDDERTIDLEIAPDVITTWLRAAVREKLAGDADPLLGEHVVDAPHVEHHEVIDAAPEHDAPNHGTGATTPGSTTAGPRTGSTDAGFSDPTATPNGNGVSAGTSTPGEPRSSN